jgi:hypothetical protein
MRGWPLGNEQAQQRDAFKRNGIGKSIVEGMNETMDGSLDPRWTWSKV